LRNKFKGPALASQYGQEAAGLAKSLGVPVQQAQILIDREKRLYPVYQGWLEANDENRAFNGYVETEFGFRVQASLDPKRSSRSGYNGHILRRAMNHQAQGNCAEILRYTVCLATERGIDVGSTIHDALMYTAPADSWEDVDLAMVQCMNEACEKVLGDSYILKSDRDVVHYPDHYQHEDGIKMWTRIVRAVEQAEAEVQPVAMSGATQGE
jgi:hypothetical protein